MLSHKGDTAEGTYSVIVLERALLAFVEVKKAAARADHHRSTRSIHGFGQRWPAA